MYFLDEKINYEKNHHCKTNRFAFFKNQSLKVYLTNYATVVGNKLNINYKNFKFNFLHSYLKLYMSRQLSY